ncbi:hypothetical protein [Methylacidimicrobium tartarophylax]|uniref:Uncharacterized protein n=1 Tax=Methylacidimicrobium tartarophylax TaxID=1041768 RepID=A0A5E6MCV7_9BACT|nr:hypothetical protein [Methylacidimicrobium tartarophylax]VVM07366.1 hypothetical protein MAMT_01711 [Methylacidimicrobium tartarophylax]
MAPKARRVNYPCDVPDTERERDKIDRTIRHRILAFPYGRLGRLV